MHQISLVFVLISLVSSQSTNVFRFEPIVILEEPPIGHLVLDLANKLDIKDLATSDYKFRFYSPHSLTSHYFLIDQLTGHVKTQRTLDREYLCENKVCGPCTLTSNCSLPIEIVATQTQSNNHKVQKFVSFDVIIEDKNEFAPKFPHDVIILNVSEAAPVNFSIPIDPAVDRDSHQTQIKYTIVPIDEKSPSYDTEIKKLNSKLKLLIDETSSQPQLNLVIMEPFDYELEKEVRFKIEASDGPIGPKTLTSSCLVILKIIDINDNLPIFDRSQYEYRLDEDKAVVGTRLIRVHAMDKDDGLNGLVKYSLDQNENFNIDETNGWISVQNDLDYEKTPVHRLVVKAQDSGLTNSMPVYTTCIIYLNDVNDNAPVLNLTIPNSIDDFNTNLTMNSQNEIELSEWTMPNTFIAQISVSDRDSGPNGKVNLELKEFRKKTEEFDEYDSGEEDEEGDLINFYEESNDFGLVHLFNNIYSIMLKQNLDRELNDKYIINITAYDNGQPVPLKTSLILKIKIKDENDNKPIFLVLQNKTSIDRVTNKVVSYEFVMDELTSQNDDYWVDVAQVKAIDQDLGKNGILYYHLKNESESFRVDKLTGLIQAKSNILDRELKDVYDFDLSVTDGTNTESVQVFIRLNDMNDNQPRFEKNYYKYQIYENYLSNDGKPFARIRAHDMDKKDTNFSTVRYELVDKNDYFRIDYKTGDLYQIKEFDYERLKDLEFRVIGFDNFKKNPSLNSTCLVRVDVIDLNDNAPQVISPKDPELPLIFSLNLNESNLIDGKMSFKLTKIIAQDPDSGSNSILKYKIEKQVKLKNSDVDIFKIDPKTGQLYLRVDINKKVTKPKRHGDSKLVGSYRLNTNEYEIDAKTPGLYGLVLNVSDSSESNPQSIRFYLFVALVGNSSDLGPQILALKSILNESNLNSDEVVEYDYEIEDKFEDSKFYRVISQFENPRTTKKRPSKLSHMKQNKASNGLDNFFGFLDMKNTNSMSYILIFLISIFVFLSVLITSLCLFSVYYKRVRQQKLSNSAKKHLCEIYTDSKKTTLVTHKSSTSPSSLTSSEFINLNSNRSSTDDEDDSGGFDKSNFKDNEEERAILIVNTSETSSSSKASNNQLLVLVSSSSSSTASPNDMNETSTTVSSKVSNFKTFKNSNPNSITSSPKQTVLVSSDYSGSYRTLPANRSLKNKNYETKQLNLPVNELFKRYELKKQATNGILESCGSSSSLNSLNKKLLNTGHGSPRVMQRNFNLNPIINITPNENNEIPDYFFKDEKEHKMFQVNQLNANKNNKILNLKQIVVDTKTMTGTCSKTDL